MKKGLAVLAAAALVLGAWVFLRPEKGPGESLQSMEEPLDFQAGEQIGVETVPFALPGGGEVTLTVSLTHRADRTVRHIGADTWDLEEGDKLALADHILTAYLDYPRESLDRLPDDMRLAMAGGALSSIHTYLTKDGKSLSEEGYALRTTGRGEEQGVRSCWLTVTELGPGAKYLSGRLVMPGYLTGIGCQQQFALSAQNSAAVSATANLRGAYDLGGVTQELAVDPGSKEAEATAEGASTGIRFTLNARNCGMNEVITADLDVTGGEEIRNSSVREGQFFDLRWTFTDGSGAETRLAAAARYD